LFVAVAALTGSCGAEHVQKGRVPPANMTDARDPRVARKRLCSFDGDADRLVYHYFKPITGTYNSFLFFLSLSLSLLLLQGVVTWCFVF
jgi:hypothetical protein